MQVGFELPRVYIDPPVFGQINPVAPNGRKLHYEYHEITAICREVREAGFNDKAVVVKRKYYSTGLPASYNMSQPKAWGFVDTLVQYSHGDRPYVPIKVMWVDGTVSFHWPEDLFLIMRAKTSYQFDEMFKEQMNNESL